MTCLTSLSYTMKADIYKPVVSQDDTGAVNKRYVYEKTVDCFIKTDIKTGIKANSFTTKIEDHTNFLYGIIKIRCNQLIASDRRVVKIRNTNGNIFPESQDPSSSGGYEGSTIFEPRGSTPIINFDGNVLEYETALFRQEVQKLS